MAANNTRLGPLTLRLPRSFTPTHQTAGLPGYPAVDVFGDAGSFVVAKFGGTVSRLSGHPPTSSAQPGGPYGWSAYIDRHDGAGTYFLTHFGQRFVKLGQILTPGDVIGTVGDYKGATNGVTPSHIHEGWHKN